MVMKLYSTDPKEDLTMISVDIVKKIMPNLKADVCEDYFPFLQEAMEEFEINKPLRESAFLAQIAHESMEFKHFKEIWGPTAQQNKYEPPSSVAKSLGNTEPGDGKRFMGRGAIQLTGRANYKIYGDMLDLDLINNPEWAEDPQVAFRIAGAYWKSKGLNPLADKPDFKEITIRINGGLNGWEDRKKYYERAKPLCGV
jgi:putative chitinase